MSYMEERFLPPSADAEYIRADLYEAERAENARLREEVERLKNPPKRYCAKCGAPEDNHPYRHLFVALETKKAPGDNAEGQ